jgi:hypothetical protein
MGAHPSARSGDLPREQPPSLFFVYGVQSRLSLLSLGYNPQNSITFARGVSLAQWVALMRQIDCILAYGFHRQEACGPAMCPRSLEQAQVGSLRELLDRGWGRPFQPVTGADGLRPGHAAGLHQVSRRQS